MLEIISSILQAEKKSDDIILKAQEECKNIILESEALSESIKNKAIDAFKGRRFMELKKAEDFACSKYNEILENGKKESDEIIEASKVKVEEISDLIMEEIVK